MLTRLRQKIEQWLFETPEQRRMREINNVYLFMARANRKRQREDEACYGDECVSRVREAEGR